MSRSSTFIFSWMCFGFAFLYIPIFVLIIFSFNNSAIISVWGGFSTRWYYELFQNEQIIEACLLSLKIAAISATFATILGTMARIAVSQFQRFRGRLLFTGLLGAELGANLKLMLPSSTLCG